MDKIVKISRLAVTCIALGCGLAGFGAAEAQAAAPAPIGQWVGPNGANGLIVQAAGDCGWRMYGAWVTGRCAWMANATGGVLTLYYQQGQFTNKLYFNVSYVAPNVITIWGDRFNRL